MNERTEGIDQTEVGAETTTSSVLAQMRGGGDDVAGPAPVAPTPGRGARVQTIVTVLVLAASAAALYAMRRQGMAAGVSFDKVPEVEYNLDPVATQPTPAQMRILADLERSSELARVTAEKLPKNPFVLDAGAAATNDGPDLATQEARRLAELERERLEREAKFAAALAGLELHGVMEGRVPLARINGATVRMGETVAELFTVVAIYGRSVDLEADGRVYTLTVGEPAAAKGGALRGPQGMK